MGWGEGVQIYNSLTGRLKELGQRSPLPQFLHLSTWVSVALKRKLARQWELRQSVTAPLGTSCPYLFHELSWQMIPGALLSSKQSWTWMGRESRMIGMQIPVPRRVKQPFTGPWHRPGREMWNRPKTHGSGGSQQGRAPSATFWAGMSLPDTTFYPKAPQKSDQPIHSTRMYLFHFWSMPHL